MLAELRVKNLGIIEDTTWQPAEGLNVITGETGAGKSLIIDAAELLLSGKADQNDIRFGAEEAEVEGIFDLPENGHNKTPTLFGGEQSLIIDCRVRRKGSNIIRINGRAATRSELTHIGKSLIDIHGQSDHLSLLNSDTHIDLLDAYANLRERRDEFSKYFFELRKIEQELAELDKNAKNKGRDEEFLRFQLDEITRAGIREGEEEELLKERNLLSSAEHLKELCSTIYHDLYEDNTERTTPVLDKLSNAITALKKIIETDKSLSGHLKYLEETVEGISETARDINKYGSHLQYDPKRLEEIELRLETIKEIKRKFGPSTLQILSFKTRLQDELDQLNEIEKKHSELEMNTASIKQNLGKLAQELSTRRRQGRKNLIAAVKYELDDLEMGQMEFDISLKQELDPTGLTLSDGKAYAYNETGVDIIEFLVSTNPGEPMKPLVKIASTGELSRFTLALKTALAGADKIPVLIFDEIDIGVGGRSGEIIGKKLWALSRNHQIICVTHLPQIAVYADAHFVVEKEETNGRTTSTIRKCDPEEHVKEIAAMLGGPNYSETAADNARELISKAERWKSQIGRAECFFRQIAKKRQGVLGHFFCQSGQAATGGQQTMLDKLFTIYSLFCKQGQDYLESIIETGDRFFLQRFSSIRYNTPGDGTAPGQKELDFIRIQSERLGKIICVEANYIRIGF